MLYKFLRVWATIMIKIFYRKFYVAGLDTIPMDKPLLIASNHPNGFMEPIIMACLFKRPLYFLVRGDVFKNPITRFFLEKTNQIPIFRFKDGFADLRKNQESISKSLKVLQDGHAILIFVEGGTQERKHLRPLQKGMARIAFQSIAADPNIDLHVLPVGINFRHNQTWRSDVMLSIGSVLPIAPIFNEFGDTPSGMTTLMEMTYNGMRDHIVHVDRQRDEQLFTDISDLQYFPLSKRFSKRVVADDLNFRDEFKLAKEINEMEKNQKIDLKGKVEELKLKLQSKGMKLSDLQQMDWTLAKTCLFILGFIPAFIGLFFNAIPYLMGIALAETKARGSIFYTSIIITSMTVFYFLYYLVFLIVSITLLGWKGIGVLILIPLGMFGLYYLDVTFSLLRKLLFRTKTNDIIPDIEGILSVLESK